VDTDEFLLQRVALNQESLLEWSLKDYYFGVAGDRELCLTAVLRGPIA